MRYLLDTDWVVDYLNGHPPAVATVNALPPEDLAIASISYAEYWEGVRGARDPARARTTFLAFLRVVRVLPLNRRVARTLGDLRHLLGLVRAPLSHRAHDLIIAATALTHDLELLTNNRRDYADIPGLRRFQSSCSSRCAPCMRDGLSRANGWDERRRSSRSR